MRNRQGLLAAAGAAATMLIGYADLASGGITLGPLLLVLAWLVLVPVAILAWR